MLAVERPAQDDAAGEFSAIALRARAAIDDTKSVVWALRGQAVDWETLVTHLRSRCVDLCANRAELDFVRGPQTTLLVPGQLAIDIVRIVQECVRNALQHGKPRSVRVRVDEGEAITLEIQDDGVGLPARRDGQKSASSGLENVELRAAEHAGHLTLGAAHPGTLVRVVLPAAGP